MITATPSRRTLLFLRPRPLSSRITTMAPCLLKAPTFPTSTNHSQAQTISCRAAHMVTNSTSRSPTSCRRNQWRHTRTRTHRPDWVEGHRCQCIRARSMGRNLQLQPEAEHRIINLEEWGGVSRGRPGSMLGSSQGKPATPQLAGKMTAIGHLYSPTIRPI